MSERIEHLRSKVITSLELPQDLFLGMPCLAFTGNKNLSIMNHRGILSYDTEQITVLAKNLRIRIDGKNLMIESYSQDEIVISGIICAMEFV